MTRLAKKVDNGCELRNMKVKVMVQVSTSDEETKNGAAVGEELDEIIETIVKDCKNLQLIGLMTIGKEGDLNVFKVRFRLFLGYVNAQTRGMQEVWV